MDVSRDEKSRSGSISDNHSKPVGVDNENTLTNCSSRAGKHFECWCSDRRDVAHSPTILSRGSRGGFAVTNSYCVAPDANVASLR
jgi:hypothetical protein